MECQAMGITQASSQMTVSSEAPRAPARGICGEAKRNSAEATRLRPYGLRRGRLSPFYRAEAFGEGRSSPCFHTGHPGEGE